ncbi:MAG: polysaccharide export protein [Myxococcales bacterium]|nr:polysaccharide export protein [Myxococcales bacterium]
MNLTVDQIASTDRIEIREAREQELTGEFIVPSSGTINFPWIGEVQVAGRTCSQVEAEITERLADGFLLNPSITCQIIEMNSRRIDVIGEVNAPGTYSYESGMTILRAIARAQGFTEDAQPNGSSVLRQQNGSEQRINIPLEDIIAGSEPNFPLVPGDTVVVPRYVFIP